MKRLSFVVYPYPKYNGAEQICSILLPTYWERCIHVTRCGGQCVDNLSLYCEQTDSERARLCYWSQGDVAALGFTESTWVLWWPVRERKGCWDSVKMSESVSRLPASPCDTCGPQNPSQISQDTVRRLVLQIQQHSADTVNIALKESTTYNEERTPPPDKMVLVTGDFLLLWRTYGI